MPDKKKWLAAAALTTTLAAGGTFGAMLGTPTLTAAQEAGSADSAPEAGERRAEHQRGDGHRGDGHRYHRRVHVPLRAAAEALGMTSEELRAEVRAGKSIAQVAEDRDVDVQAVIDAMVSAATENIEQRMTDLVNRSRPAREEA